MVSRLPKKGKAGLTDQLSQDEFMALLSGGLATVEEDGTWKMTDAPFSSGMVNGTSMGIPSALEMK